MKIYVHPIIAKPRPLYTHCSCHTIIQDQLSMV